MVRWWLIFRFRNWPLLHLVTAFKRWMWSRCAECCGSFEFYSWPTFAGFIDDPDCTGPRWFRGEKKLYHDECNAARQRRLRAAHDRLKWFAPQRQVHHDATVRRRVEEPVVKLRVSFFDGAYTFEADGEPKSVVSAFAVWLSIVRSRLL